MSMAMAAHLQQQTTTLAVCWKVKQVNGAIKGFTSNVQNISYDLGDGDGSVVYKASTGMAPSDIKSSTGSSVDNNNVTGLLNSPDLIDTDILDGFYDHAKITQFLVNYNDLSMSHVILNKDYFGQAQVGSVGFDVELRSLAQLLGQQVGKVCTPTCQVTLGDAKCTKDLTAFTFTGLLDAAVDNRQLNINALTALSEPDDFFAQGKLTFTSGELAGWSFDIKNSAGNLISLYTQLTFLPTLGCSVTVVAGCDKLLNTCISKFNNVVNFHGFPHVSGADAVLRIVS